MSIHDSPVDKMAMVATVLITSFPFAMLVFESGFGVGTAIRTSRKTYRPTLATMTSAMTRLLPT